MELLQLYRKSLSRKHFNTVYNVTVVFNKYISSAKSKYVRTVGYNLRLLRMTMVNPNSYSRLLIAFLSA